jgi:hypothetical protein
VAVMVVVVVVAGWLVEVPGCSGLVGIPRTENVPRRLRVLHQLTSGNGTDLKASRASRCGRRQLHSPGDWESEGNWEKMPNFSLRASQERPFDSHDCQLYELALPRHRRLHFGYMNFTLVCELRSNVLDAPPRYTCVEFARLALPLPSRESCRETTDLGEIAPFYLLEMRNNNAGLIDVA